MYSLFLGASITYPGAGVAGGKVGGLVPIESARLLLERAAFRIALARLILVSPFCHRARSPEMRPPVAKTGLSDRFLAASNLSHNDSRIRTIGFGSSLKATGQFSQPPDSATYRTGNPVPEVPEESVAGAPCNAPHTVCQAAI